MAKTLILFYSRSGENHYDGGLRILEVGNAKRICSMIAEETGGDLFEVETVTPYGERYQECVRQAVAEWKGNARPAVKQIPADVSGFDKVVVAYPIWCGTMPMCLYTVLEELDLSGKRIYAVATHEGSGYAASVGHLKELCPGGEVLEGLSVKGCQVDASEEMIRGWARENLK